MENNINTTGNNTSSSLLRKNIVLNTIFRVLMIIAPFITAPYVSRVLLSDGVGIYSYTQSLVTYFTMFAALGTISYGTREIARKRDNRSDYSKTFWEIELISIICSAIALLAWIILSISYLEYRTFLLIFSFSILATCFDISWLYAGLEKYKYTVGVNLLFKIISVVLIFVLVKKPDDVWLYILIYSASLFLGNASMWLFLPKILVKTKINKHSLKHHFKETLIYFIPAVATSLYTVLDKTLIGSLIPGTTTVIVDGKEVVKKTSEVESGYYEQATKIIDIVKAVAFVSIHSVMSSRSSYLYKIDDKKQIKELMINTFDLTLFLSIGAAFGLIGVAPYFVPVFFGAGYDKTVLILQILACLVPIICISGALGSVYYTPVGKRKQSSLFLIIGAVINLGLSAPLIIYFQSVGAAIASVIAETVIVVLYFAFCKKAITLKEFLTVIWKKLIAGGLMLGSIFLFINFVSIPNKYLFFFVIFVLGFSIYILALLALRDRSMQKFISLVFKRRKKDYEQ
ncbi:MAG: oligosaccharide flippase family protein [Bacilli bacterium]|nr:oligosaccharide flippase family protein [Bacilli bacterium]